MGVKRNCSASFTVEIANKKDNISKVEIVFKKKPEPEAEELLRLEYGEKDFSENSEAPDEYVTTIDCNLKPEDTFKLTAGTVYMDLRVILADGYVVPTDMMVIDDVGETLFDDVYTGEVATDD